MHCSISLKIVLLYALLNHINKLVVRVNPFLFGYKINSHIQIQSHHIKD